MKYLKKFESITNNVNDANSFIQYYGFTPEDFEDFFVRIIDKYDLEAEVNWESQGLNRLFLKIIVPVDFKLAHDWYSENIKPRLERINYKLKRQFSLDFSGYQFGMIHHPTRYYYRLIWYKT